MAEWKGRLGDRLIREREHDTYKSRGKLPEPTVCPGCGAVYRRGRWNWADRPEGAHEHTCPACHRVQDRYPAGFVDLSGGFVGLHRQEILGLVRNLEAREKSEHPLKRIIAIDEESEAIAVTTTDIHLARAIGDALHDAYEGDLDYHYAEESNVLRVRWRRES